MKNRSAGEENDTGFLFFSVQLSDCSGRMPRICKNGTFKRPNTQRLQLSRSCRNPSSDKWSCEKNCTSAEICWLLKTRLRLDICDLLLWGNQTSSASQCLPSRPRRNNRNTEHRRTAVRAARHLSHCKKYNFCLCAVRTYNCGQTFTSTHDEHEWPVSKKQE